MSSRLRVCKWRLEIPSPSPLRQIANPNPFTHMSNGYKTPIQVKDLDLNAIILSSDD